MIQSPPINRYFFQNQHERNVHGQRSGVPSAKYAMCTQIPIEEEWKNRYLGQRPNEELGWPFSAVNLLPLDLSRTKKKCLQKSWKSVLNRSQLWDQELCSWEKRIIFFSCSSSHHPKWMISASRSFSSTNFPLWKWSSNSSFRPWSSWESGSISMF